MKTTPNRRLLRFNSLDEAVADAERLVAAEREGRLSRVGKFELGQTFGHLATWAELPFIGYPKEVHAPLPVRMILKLMRNQILNKGMIEGVRVGKIPGGTLGLDVIPADEGLSRLRNTFTRLQSECPTSKNPVFGVLTHQQWIALNCRHAELHLSFQRMG